jgi:2,5-furandicarboxylate decarboxylase 1
MRKDIRTWIGQLDEAGLLRKITNPVDPLTHLSFVLYRNREREVLFESLDGCPGWRSLGQAPASPAKAAIAFDVPPEKLMPFIAERRKRPVACEEVADGPVKEEILKDDKVDLSRIPIKVCGVKEAGPYIFSGLCITGDPETGRRNTTIHRMQLKGSRKTGILMQPGHTFMTYQN